MLCDLYTVTCNGLLTSVTRDLCHYTISESNFRNTGHFIYGLIGSLTSSLPAVPSMTYVGFMRHVNTTL